jgi:endonuclease/exonuclease/phosphatase (EEP) superfamily protein YafD
MNRSFHTVAVCIGTFALTGCGMLMSGQPDYDANQLSTHDHVIAYDVGACRDHLRITTVSVGTELDADSISVLVWNAQKGSRVMWRDDMLRLAADKDLILIQEASYQSPLTEDLPDKADGINHWVFAPGYESSTQLTGVMTLSKGAPMTQCNLANQEPWLGTLKATSITEYGLSGTDETLVVVNIHAVNFTFGVAEFQSQMDQVRMALAGHDGPVILSGDFNTWRKKRVEILDLLAADLGLDALSFEDDNRKTVFGYPVDHLYVRGLTVRSAGTQIVKTSDHNPLLAEFSL